MKRKTFIVMTVILSILLTSCANITDYRSFILNSEEAMSEKRVDEILDAIQNRDREALRSVFSKYALENAENFDENMDALFDYFQGEVISTEIHGRRTGDANLPDGRSEKIMGVPCFVTTSEQTYHMYFTDYITFTEDEDKEGVLCLYIIKAEDHTYESAYRFDNEEIPGINVATPLINEATNLVLSRLETMLEALETQDKEAFESLFSKEAIEKSECFDKDLDTLFEYFEGEDELYGDIEYCDVGSVDDNKKTEETYSSYVISSKERVYRVCILDVMIDNENPDRVGFWSAYMEGFWKTSYQDEFKNIPGIHIAVSQSDVTTIL